MEVLSYPSEDVLGKASEAVNVMLEREFGGPLLFLLAGGSSEAIYPHIRAEFLGSHMTLTVSDERLSTDPGAHNFGQVAETEFYRNAKNRNCAFINITPFPNETVEGLGKRFDKALKDWRDANPEGRIVMTQGIGKDGHTCGIMPFPGDDKKFNEFFDDKIRWAVGYDAEGRNEYPLRATVTLPFLREVDESIVYAVGGSKHGALKDILERSQKLNDVPAFILREMKKVTVFTDQKV